MKIIAAASDLLDHAIRRPTCAIASPHRQYPATLINNVQQRLAFFEPAQVVGEQRDERRPVVLHRARGVRRDDDVRQIPVRARRLERLLVNTSSAAPPSRPSRSASTTASSSMSLPRATLTSSAPRLHPIDLARGRSAAWSRACAAPRARRRRSARADPAADPAPAPSSTPSRRRLLRRRRRIAETRNPNGAASFDDLDADRRRDRRCPCAGRASANAGRRSFELVLRPAMRRLRAQRRAAAGAPARS